MKIGFVVPGFSADELDWCIPAHTDIVRALAEANEVHVFTMRYPHRVDNYRIGKARVHSFNGVGSRGAASGQLWVRVLNAIADEHKRGRFDVVHAIFGSEAGCVAVIAGKRLGIESVVWLVNGELIGLPDIGYGADLYTRQRWMNQIILRFASQVLCGCEAMADEARRRAPASRRGSIERLPLGVNLERFSTRGRRRNPTERAHFVNVGSLVQVKGQALLLRAFAEVAKSLPGAQLTIAGQGPLEAELRELAARLDVAASVRFAGNVPHDQLAELYREADVFVQASRHEGQGMALLEAAACGAAAAGTRVGALVDLMHAGGAVGAECSFGRDTRHTGVKANRISDGDADALARAMLRVHSEQIEVGARARRIVESEYNLEHIHARLEERYRAARGRTDVAFGPKIARA